MGEQPMNMIRLFIGLVGSFLSIEAFGNLLYWRRKSCLLFQAGRALRLSIGITLIIIGLVGGL